MHTVHFKQVHRLHYILLTLVLPFQAVFERFCYAIYLSIYLSIICLYLFLYLSSIYLSLYTYVIYFYPVRPPLLSLSPSPSTGSPISDSPRYTHVALLFLLLIIFILDLDSAYKQNVIFDFFQIGWFTQYGIVSCSIHFPANNIISFLFMTG
jgi:hypothetical protein